MRALKTLPARVACATPALLGLLVLAGCGKAPPAQTPDQTAPRTAARTPAAAVPHPEPADEPSEPVLVALLREQYQAITAAGGMPVTVTASGRNLVLKPVLHEARKDQPCRRLPGGGGEWECSLAAMVTLREGDRKPGAHNERLIVHWDATQGRWANGSAPRRK